MKYIGLDDLLETELKNAARRQNDNLRKRRKKNAPLLSCKKPKKNKIYSGAYTNIFNTPSHRGIFLDVLFFSLTLANLYILCA